MGMGMGGPSGPLSATCGCTHTPWVGMGYQWVWVWVWEKIPGGYPCQSLEAATKEVCSVLSQAADDMAHF